MPTLAINLLVMAFVMSGLLLGGLTIFAFGEPLGFIRWMSQLNWVANLTFGENRVALQRALSFACGSVMLFVLLMICFALGGWFTTAFLGLWSSPFSRILLP